MSLTRRTIGRPSCTISWLTEQLSTCMNAIGEQPVAIAIAAPITPPWHTTAIRSPGCASTTFLARLGPGP